MTNPPTILVVDDTPANIELVENVLVVEGFQTLTAGDGRTAFELAQQRQPNLILMDVVMPHESGFETCARLKSNPETADIPIIFLSALDDVKSRVTGLKMGGVDFISKPVHGEEVLARVRVHLRICEINRNLVMQSRTRLEELRHAQQAILVHPEECPEASFGVYYEPLEEVGGDFYDVVKISPHVFAYFVADISGHGATASFLTSAVKALLRQYAGPMYSPEDAMRGVDSVIRQLLGEEQYLTACYASLNLRTRRLSVVSAGHPPLILAKESGEVCTVDVDSDPLGIFSTAVLHRKEVRVARGDRFYLYSDGLIESTPGAGRQQGLERLVGACLRHRRLEVREAPSRIAGDLRPTGSKLEDDLVLMAVEVCE